MATVYYGIDRTTEPDGTVVNWALFSNSQFSTPVGEARLYDYREYSSPEDSPAYGRTVGLVRPDPISGTYMWLSSAGKLYLPQNAKYMFAGCKGSWTQQAFRPECIRFDDCLRCVGLFQEGEIKSFSLTNENKFNTVLDASYMFCNCKSLEYVHVDVTSSYLQNATSMFHGCESFDRFTNFSGSWVDDHTNITNMTNMFAGCTSLETFNYPLFTGKATSLAGMFDGCIKLKTLSGNFSTGTSQNFEAMFRNCDSLEMIDISGFNFGNAKNMNYMFSECDNLWYIKLPNSIPTKVTQSKETYSLCPKLMIILAPYETDWDIGQSVDSTEMFKDSPKLPHYDPSLIEFSKANNLDEKEGYYVYEYTVPYLCDVFEKINGSWEQKTTLLKDSEGWNSQETMILVGYGW